MDRNNGIYAWEWAGGGTAGRGPGDFFRDALRVSGNFGPRVLGNCSGVLGNDPSSAKFREGAPPHGIRGGAHNAAVILYRIPGCLQIFNSEIGMF